MLTNSILGYAGVILLYLNVGTPISWGANATYLASYFTALNQKDCTAFKMAAIAVTMTGSMALAYLAEMRFQPKFSLMWKLACSYVCLAFCSYSASYILAPTTFIMAYGVSVGFFLGLTIHGPLDQLTRFLKHNDPIKIKGVALIAVGCSQTIYGQLFRFYVNTSNVPIKDGMVITNTLKQDIPSCLRYLTIVQFLIGVTGTVLLYMVVRVNQKSRQMEEDREDDLPSLALPGRRDCQTKSEYVRKAGVDSPMKVKSNTPSVDLNVEERARTEINNVKKSRQFPMYGRFNSNRVSNLHEEFILPNWLELQNRAETVSLVKSALFWALSICFVLSTFCNIIICLHFRSFLKQSLTSDLELANYGSVFGILLGASRLLFTYLFRKAGYRCIIRCLVSINLLIFTAIKFTFESPRLFFLLLTLNSITLGGFCCITQLQLFKTLSERASFHLLTLLFFTCVVSQLAILFVRQLIGVDNIMWLGVAVGLLTAPFVGCYSFQQSVNIEQEITRKRKVVIKSQAIIDTRDQMVRHCSKTQREQSVAQSSKSVVVRPSQKAIDRKKEQILMKISSNPPTLIKRSLSRQKTKLPRIKPEDLMDELQEVADIQLA